MHKMACRRGQLWSPHRRPTDRSPSSTPAHVRTLDACIGASRALIWFSHAADLHVWYVIPVGSALFSVATDIGRPEGKQGIGLLPLFERGTLGHREGREACADRLLVYGE
jgi:hypothetical protein